MNSQHEYREVRADLLERTKRIQSVRPRDAEVQDKNVPHLRLDPLHELGNGARFTDHRTGELFGEQVPESESYDLMIVSEKDARGHDVPCFRVEFAKLPSCRRGRSPRNRWYRRRHGPAPSCPAAPVRNGR